MSDPIVFGVSVFAVMLLLIGIGFPVAISMGVVAVAGMVLTAGLPFALSNLGTLPYAIASDFGFAVIPMFVLMGALTTATGISTELYTAAYRWTSRLRGSLYYATTLAAGGFGAINGSSMVSSALFTRIALPEMLKFNYDRSLSAGCIAAAGTFAAMIPPSVAMVLYAILADQSVGRLLMAGVAPGLLTVLAYMIGLRVILRISPDKAPLSAVHITLKDKLDSVRGLWATILLVVVVMGGIYSGLVYPSTAGAAGAFGALAIGLVRRRLGAEPFWDAVKQSVTTTAVLFLIVIAGMLLSRLLLISGFVGVIVDAVGAAGLGPLELIFGVVLIYLVLGMFIDTVSLMVMTIPFLYPIAKALGIDLVWFGVIVVKLIEIAAITPPVGLNLFAVTGASEGRVTSKDLYRGVAPFIAIEAAVLIVLIAFPEISLWLPNRMFD
jgi:C4-dicarboxylate transporter, DctM subunit